MRSVGTRFSAVLALLLGVGAAPSAHAFCGLYVAGAGKALDNSASQVAIVRHEGHTTITMENEYEGDPSDFSLVVPVPVVLKEKDVKTVANKLFDRLDRFTAPRLVEYDEQDPCLAALSEGDDAVGVGISCEIKCENPVRGQWGPGKPNSMGGNLPTNTLGAR